MATQAAASAKPGAANDIVFKQITGTFGANVTGIDLSRPLDAETVEIIENALGKYRVLAFRDQHAVGPHELHAFAENFGETEKVEHPSHPGYEGLPGVKVLESNSTMTNNRIVDTWHTDGATRDSTRYISVLQAVDVPDAGRDTAFADMVTAYERLSEPMKHFLEGLTAEHNWGSQKPGSESKFHPLILTDKKTGQKAIYANRIYTKSIPELRNDESDMLLEFLMGQARIPEFQLRVNWEPGTIAMWNNELVQHYLVFDRDYDRVMHRVMVI